MWSPQWVGHRHPAGRRRHHGDVAHTYTRWPWPHCLLPAWFFFHPHTSHNRQGRWGGASPPSPSVDTRIPTPSRSSCSIAHSLCNRLSDSLFSTDHPTPRCESWRIFLTPRDDCRLQGETSHCGWLQPPHSRQARRCRSQSTRHLRRFRFLAAFGICDPRKGLYSRPRFDDLVRRTSVLGFFSDHRSVLVSLTCRASRFPSKKISFRLLLSIDPVTLTSIVWVYSWILPTILTA